jgi:hypothetical protein
MRSLEHGQKLCFDGVRTNQKSARGHNATDEWNFAGGIRKFSGFIARKFSRVSTRKFSRYALENLARTHLKI